jgi:hypothetical protein
VPGFVGRLPVVVFAVVFAAPQAWPRAEPFHEQLRHAPVAAAARGRQRVVAQSVAVPRGRGVRSQP